MVGMAFYIQKVKNMGFSKTILLFTMVWMLFYLSACKKPNLSNIKNLSIQTIGTEDYHAIHFINDSIGYLAGGDRFYLGKLLKTTNAGKTWDSIDIKTNKILYDIAFTEDTLGFVCGLNSKIVSNKNGDWQLYQQYTFPLWRALYGVHFSNNFGMSCGGNGNGYGILIRSSNYFDTFVQDTFNFELRSVFMTNDSTAYAAGFGAIIKTSNFGESWEHLMVEGDFYTDVYFTSTNDGYAVGQQGSILKTIDAGENWQYIRKANSLIQKRVLFNAIYFKDDSKGYIVGEKGAFWISHNAGLDWEEHNVGKHLNLKAVFATNSTVYLVGENGGFVVIEE